MKYLLAIDSTGFIFSDKIIRNEVLLSLIESTQCDVSYDGNVSKTNKLMTIKVATLSDDDKKSSSIVGE
jgi:hypothetical protein